MNIKPLYDKVVIQPLVQETERKTDSGIYLNSEAKENSKKQGTILSVGPGAWNEDGDGRIEMTVKEGDVVLYSWGDTVEHEGATYEIVSESQILAIIN